MVKKTFTVTSLDNGQRIDKYLKKILNSAPSNLIYKLLRTKDVRVNNKKISPDYLLSEGDIVFIFLTDAQAEEFLLEYTFATVEPEFDVVYEDENILAVNKKSGLLVHPSEKKKEFTLNNMVLTYLSRKGEFNNEIRSYIPSPVARIDQDTTGIVVFSKKQSVHQMLATAFTTESEVKRVYRAVVYGRIDNVEGEINFPLIKEDGMVKVSQAGKVAITRYKVIARGKDKTYVEAILLTGRQHQIRVHFKALGHPIVGDKKYGNKNDAYRLALNAYSLAFNKLEFPLSYLNAKELIADDTAYLEKILGDENERH